MLAEEWRTITGYESLYEVSSMGRVRSNDRMIFRVNSAPYILTGRIMKIRIDRDGYELVTLNLGHKPQTFKVHRLVAQEFLQNLNNLPQVDHKDGVRNHNHKTNLRWVTVKDNCLLKHNIKQASGYRGVRLQSRPLGDRYQAYCHDHVSKRFVHIGVFGTAEEASRVRSEFILGNPNVSAL